MYQIRIQAQILVSCPQITQACKEQSQNINPGICDCRLLSQCAVTSAENFCSKKVSHLLRYKSQFVSLVVAYTSSGLCSFHEWMN